jgi:hypothetical protein
MSAREFKQCSLRYGDRFVAGIEVRCPCGATAQHTRGSSKTNVGRKEEIQRYRNWFEREGWTIGDRPRDDRCPKCTRAARAVPKLTVVPKQEKPMLSPSDRAAALAPAASKAPPEPSREDKRLINAKLDEVYDTNAQRYSGSWTDAKLAVDMGVPRAWVEKQRNDLYGPEGSNQEINSAVNEANAVLASACTLLANTEKAITEARATLGSLAGEHQRLTGIVDRVSRKIEGIEKAVRP